jgi:hypothetical protein
MVEKIFDCFCGLHSGADLENTLGLEDTLGFGAIEDIEKSTKSFPFLCDCAFV